MNIEKRETMEQVHKWSFRITTNNKRFFLFYPLFFSGCRQREMRDERKDNWTVSFSRVIERENDGRERENGQLNRAECMCIQSMQHQRGYVHQRAACGISSLTHLHN
jgi:hypothetical protein